MRTDLAVGAPAAFGAFTNEELAAQPAMEPRDAVLVVHGMGRQSKFETLDSVVRGIEKASGGVAAKVARNVSIGGERLSRMELTLADGRRIDVYEGYWAPITEGQVTLRDVMAFLAGAAWNGWKNSRAFGRWVFDDHRAFQVGRRTALHLLLAAGVLFSLVFMNTLTVTLATTRAIDRVPDWLQSEALVTDLTAAILMFLAVALGFVLTMLSARRNATPNRDAIPLASRFGLWYFLATAGYTVLVAVTMLFAIGLHRNEFWRYIAWGSGWLTAVGGTALLAAAALICLYASFESRARWWDILGVVVAAVAAIVVLVLAGAHGDAPGRSVFDYVAVPFSAPEKLRTKLLWFCERWVLIWVALAVVSARVRRFLVQYVGDVAAYVTPNALDRFNDIRERVRDCVFKTSNAVFRAKSPNGNLAYDRIAIVGHSLGSVVAYDCVNRMLNEDAHAGGGMRVRERTAGLLTFGSPLDKTAFLFETNVDRPSAGRAAIAATVQPLVCDAATRSIRWHNVYTPLDIISGGLQFYDTPGAKPNRVQDHVDFDATSPVGAHTQYWDNPLIWRLLDGLLPPRVIAFVAPRTPKISVRRPAQHVFAVPPGATRIVVQ